MSTNKKDRAVLYKKRESFKPIFQRLLITSSHIKCNKIDSILRKEENVIRMENLLSTKVKQIELDLLLVKFRELDGLGGYIMLWNGLSAQMAAQTGLSNAFRTDNGDSYLIGLPYEAFLREITEQCAYIPLFYLRWKRLQWVFVYF